jgi:FkbM family methyltransferase
MPIREQIKITLKTILDATGIRPYYFGVNLYDDIRLKLPKQKLAMLFDVGANDGHTSSTWRKKYPLASIHCFEPNPECCAALKVMDERLFVHELALGNKTGEIGFNKSNGQSDMYYVSDEPTDEMVKVDTLDNFATQNGVEHIDFLKIDAEGYDLNVILGAAKMLDGPKIDLVQAEVSMNSDNVFHVSFFDVDREMERHHYRLFGIYEQVFEWGKNVPYLRRSNVVYISPTVAAANKLYSHDRG